MPSIHPSETPALGWLVPCLAVADLEASIAFYAKLGLAHYGGNVDEGWAMLRNRAVELHLFHPHIQRDALNFRGGSPAAIRVAMEERGLSVDSEMGARSFTYLDPDGRPVFIDSGPDEEAAYATGQPLTIAIEDEDVQAGEGLDLGNLSCCLACADLEQALAFYETLGFVRAGGQPASGWAILARADHLPAPGKRLIATYLSLFKDMIPRDMLSFRGGHVAAISETLQAAGIDLKEGLKTAADGGETLLIEDPDGRPVFFDTGVDERLYAD